MNTTSFPDPGQLAGRVWSFIEKHVLPLEGPDGPPPTGPLRSVQELARREGLWAPQLPRELGGLGLNLVDLCPVFEAAGRSLLGPLCLGCAAPDEGNAHLLHLAASPDQRSQYLEPLARGDIRSAFAMTEPAPGAGADPSQMLTRATRDGSGWVLDGDKWFATGAAGAAFLIVAAVTAPDPTGQGKNRITLFLVDAGTPGLVVRREIPVLGSGTPGGHCEVELRSCRVRSDRVLGTVDGGYALIQARLGPARLTHCMRWIGAAQRALDFAVQRALHRRAFGKTLVEHQGVEMMIADSAIDLHASRRIVEDAARRIVGGDPARVETSICKVFVAEAVWRVVDRAVQLCGAQGIMVEQPVARIFEEARAFRIYDGPSEVHRMVVAREALKALRRAPTTDS